MNTSFDNQSTLSPAISSHPLWSNQGQFQKFSGSSIDIQVLIAVYSMFTYFPSTPLTHLIVWSFFLVLNRNSEERRAC